jgi:hypothetical protein
MKSALLLLACATIVTWSANAEDLSITTNEWTVTWKAPETRISATIVLHRTVPEDPAEAKAWRDKIEKMPTRQQANARVGLIGMPSNDEWIYFNDEAVRLMPMIVRESKRIVAAAQKDSGVKPFTQSLATTGALQAYAINYDGVSYRLVSDGSREENLFAAGTALTFESLDAAAAIVRALPKLRLQAQSQRAKRY